MGARTPVIFLVVPATMSGAENTSVHVEPDERYDTAGPETDDVLDSVFGDGTTAGKHPVDDFSTDTPAPTPDDTPRNDPPTAVETTPAETVPVDTVPVETIPVDTVPVDTVPVETIPVDTVPVETVPVETAPPAEEPSNAGLVGECFALLETHPTLTEIEPGLFGACESAPGEALTIINELLAELGA